MLRPVTIRTTGRSGTRGSAASAAAADGSALIPASQYVATPLSQRVFGDEQELVRGLLDPLHCARDRDAHGEAVGDRRAAIRFDDVSRVPALDHHRRLLGRDAHDAHAVAEPARDAREQRAVSQRDDHRGRRFFHLLQDLRADRRVAVELRRIVAVLEEAQAPLGCERAGGVLCLVEIGALLPQVGALRADQGELRGARLLRHEDGRLQAEALRGPRRRGAVIARRGGDDVGAPALQGGQRASPLEGAELVRVLAFEVDAVLPALERGRDGHRAHETTLGACRSTHPWSRACAGVELAPSTFRRLAFASAFMLWLIVASGATVRPDRVRARLRALAGLHCG